MAREKQKKRPTYSRNAYGVPCGGVPMSRHFGVSFETCPSSLFFFFFFSARHILQGAPLISCAFHLWMNMQSYNRMPSTLPTVLFFPWREHRAR